MNTVLDELHPSMLYVKYVDWFRNLRSLQSGLRYHLDIADEVSRIIGKYFPVIFWDVLLLDTWIGKLSAVRLNAIANLNSGSS